MKIYHRIIAGLLLVIFIFLSVQSALLESLTYDEIVDVEEGRAALIPHTFSVDPYNPPFIKEVTTLPLLLGFDILYPSLPPYLLMFPGRLAAIGLGFVLLLAVFWITNIYFGVNSALFALFLLAFEPNILGHSHYITLDTGFTLFFFLACVAFLALLKNPNMRNIIFSGVTLGFALGSKITALTYFFPSAGMLFLFMRKKKLSAPIKYILKYIFVSLGIVVVVLWALYFFQTDVIVIKHDDPSRVSSRLIAYADAHNMPGLILGIELLQNQKVPLGTYLSVVKNNIIRSRQAENISWYVMLINVLLKTPLPLLLFFSFSLFSMFGKPLMRKALIPFLIPVIIILAVSSVSNMSPWVRYVLPLYPFLAIIASVGIDRFRGVHWKLLFAFLISWYVIGTTNQFPHFISYANELAGPREKRFEKFTDSNIDWGQGLISLQKYSMEKKPSTLFLSYFGRDDGSRYGFISDKQWGSYKFDEICAFHTINFPASKGETLVAISISNWYACGYATQKMYSKANIIDIVGDSILIFSY